MENFIKNPVKAIVYAIVAIIAVFIIFSTWNIVSSNERGLIYTLGKVSDDVLEPGLQFKMPFFQRIKTWSVVPNEYDITIDIAEDAAISKDNQSIGVRTVVYWKYDIEKLPYIAKNWNDNRIVQQLKVTSIQSIKSIVGKYTVFDLAPSQAAMANEIYDMLSKELAKSTVPINVTQVSITNFDWSDEFDKQIKETMNRSQQVKQSEQEANIAEQQNRKISIEAEAKARAQVAQAQGELDAAKLRAEAQLVEAKATAEANRIKAQPSSLEFQKAQWDFEVKMERARHLAPGVEVPLYIPLAPNGTTAAVVNK
jgi:regulator of protease activity HflC (stomatin/prohibitin superfamily)